MTDELAIEYQLGQHGWSQFRLTVGDASTVVGEFGYCTDALGDLVRAALLVATSGTRAEVSFDGAPTEWRLIVTAEFTEAANFDKRPFVLHAGPSSTRLGRREAA